MTKDVAVVPKRSKSKDLWKIGKPQLHVVLSPEEDRILEQLRIHYQDPMNSFGPPPSKADTIRQLLRDAHDRVRLKEYETITGMFNRVIGALDSMLAQQSTFRTDLTRDVMRLVERAGNSADRVTMVMENATEKIGSRVENSIAITRQMEMDLKDQLAAANKMLYATLLRVKIEQAYLSPHILETLKEGLKQAGLSGV